MGAARVGWFSGLSTRARVGGLVSLLFAALSITSVAPAGAVTGGTQIPITDAPWQVEIVSLGASGFPYCGGAIVSDRLVLTAAHCVTNVLYTSLVAGVSEYNTKGPTEQPDHVKSVRIDPKYSPPTGSQPSADDIAVLELETPLNFGGGAVEPIALAPSGSDFAAGTAVHLTGFGQREAGTESSLNETLYSLTTKLVSSSECGVEAGPFLCTTTSDGTTCTGDSGSGLTLPGAPATLIGLVDRAEPSSGETCAAGSKDAFVNLADPGIRQFIGTIPSGEGAPQAPSSGQEGAAKMTRSSVRLAATKLNVSGADAIVKLDCSGSAACKGKLTLTVVKTLKVKGKKRKETVTIGTESFSVAGGATAKIKIKLSSYARSQIRSTHGHLKASVELVGHETEPTHERTEAVTIL